MGYGNCFLCKKWSWMEEHHIFGGSNRNKSEKYGLKIDLCLDCHKEGKQSAHKCADTAQKLHEYGQKKYMEEHNASIDDFRKVFGKNYLPIEETT